MRSFLLPIVSLMFALSARGPLCAQTIPANPVPIVFGHSVVALNGPWKFHIGDNPQWADPNFDDSHWETVDLTPRPGVEDPFTHNPKYVPGWTTRGHPGYWGYAWYRIDVAAAAEPGEKLAVMADGVDDGYQVFAQGKLLGSNGQFRAGKYPVVYFPQPQIFVLPPSAARTQVLAFRVWMGPVRLSHHPFTGGFHYAPLLGESGAIAEQTHIAWLELVRHYAFSGILSGVFLLLTILAASLILFDRSDRVYLWVAGAFLLAMSREVVFSLANWTQLVSLREFFFALEAFIAPLAIGMWAMVWWKWFQLRRPFRMPRAIAALTGLDMIFELLGENLFYAIPPSLGQLFHAASGVVRLGLLALLVFIVAKGIREQGKEGWLVLPAVTLMAFEQFQSELISLHLHGTFIVFGTVAFYNEAADLALATSIALLLLRRLLLSLQRQRQMALDIKQAQEVQQVLIPREQPPIPGLDIETEYRPAREVGGDFFQIVQHPTDGSVLIVAGDVAGKGLKAGMMVALLVGAIRTATDISLDPEFVLRVLNRRLLRRGDCQATCLALLLGNDGEATMANAGHVAPYRNSEPLAMEGALPLGMMEGAEFSVMHFQLNPGDKLVLMSDGIAEATDERGQLFGFERVHELLRTASSAAEIAAAAQNFGQEDDITVLSLTFAGVEAAHV
ncbi:MAG: SpoIIE family protein phosphatase [Terracidiphilus sp.]